MATLKQTTELSRARVRCLPVKFATSPISQSATNATVSPLALFLLKFSYICGNIATPQSSTASQPYVEFELRENEKSCVLKKPKTP